MPTISGFNHISLSVTDPERSATWYESVLGFARHGAAGKGASFQRIRMFQPDSGVTLTLTGHHDGSGDAFSERRTGLDHLAFTAGSDDIATWKRHFEELGVAHSDIRVLAVGGGAITLRDPDNIQLEVFTLPG